MAAECFILLMLDELNEMLVSSLFSAIFNLIENVARILKFVDLCVLDIAGEAFGHRQVIEL
jgi:hypothetical protein